MRRLSIDLECFSSVDLKKSGVYKYVDSPDFEILLFGYAYDDDPVQIISLVEGEILPGKLVRDLRSADVLKTAYNAAFEITCLNAYFSQPLVINQWSCTMVHSLCLGLPAGLADVAIAMSLDVNKDTAGTRLINYFCKPCKPTIVGGGRTRNMPEHKSDDWELFKEYCKTDVEVERALKHKLDKLYTVSNFEKQLWMLDYEINSTGLEINTQLVKNAIECNDLQVGKMLQEAQGLTGLENPASGDQLKKWFLDYEGLEVKSLAKEVRADVYKQLKTDNAKQALTLYAGMKKTSVAKYKAMEKCLCSDNRVRGLLQFYGASRSGRWGGRLIQVQNLPKNIIPDLDDARDYLLSGDYESLYMLYPSVPGVLSQLIRTAFEAKAGYKYLVTDFSAIEARVIAWLADEKWRLDVFATHGKIYEASASQMFHVPIEQITKSSPLRQKGKVAELALGYQGGAGALLKMGADKMGLSDDEMQEIVTAWRAANPSIKKLWYTAENAARTAISEKTTAKMNKDITFTYTDSNLYVKLPSGRRLCYFKAHFGELNDFGKEKICYFGVHQEKQKKYGLLDTYGGKLIENIVQAIARDCLAVAMMRLSDLGYNIVMHVHDEIVMEVPEDENHFHTVDGIMSKEIDWAKGLILKGDSYETKYYKKD